MATPIRCLFFTAAGLVAALPPSARAVPVNDVAAAAPDTPPATETLGFKSEVFAGGGQLQNPTSIAFDPAGRLLVTETHRWMDGGVEDNRMHTYWIMDDLATQTLAGRQAAYDKWKANFAADYFTAKSERVKRLTDTDGDGRADAVTVFADGFNSPLDGPAIGVLARDRTRTWLACIPNVWELEDTDDDGVAEKRTVVAGGFGIKTSLAGHDLHGLTWGPDGLLYFSMGDRGFVTPTKEGGTLADPNAGAVFRCQPDGTGLEVFYHGLRNPQELAFNELGDLITVDNNCDQGDAARVCWLVEGGDSGWHIGHQALTTYKPYINDGGLGQAPHWLSEGLWEKSHDGQPRWILPPINHLSDGPSGLVFTSGLSLPAAYSNSFLLCDYKGAANQCRLWSFKVAARGDGGFYEVRDGHLFQSGIASVDVDEGPDGRFYVADFGGTWTKGDAGTVFALWWPEGVKRAEVSDARALLTGPDAGSLTTEVLLPLLDHADHRVRQRAQFALAARGAQDPAVVVALADWAAKGQNLNALWALRQLRALDPLRSLLTHSTAEVRAQAARALGDLRDAGSVPTLLGLLGAEAPRERLMASLALAKLGNSAVLGDAVTMIAQRGVDDPFQRHAGVMLLAGAVEAKTLAGLAGHTSPAVRLSAVLALRRQRSPLIVDFLRDAEAAVAGEAVRAINDLPIADAVPVLAAEARRFVGQAPPPVFDSDPQYRRLLRANQMVGTPEAAARLARLAVHPALSEERRVLALRTLEHFAAPPPIDPTSGLWRPLPARDKVPIREAMAPILQPLLTQARGAATGGALSVAGVFEIPVGETTLAAWAADEKQPLALRLAAVGRLGQGVRPLLNTATPEVRTAAARRWVAVQPDDFETALRILLAHATTGDLRTAYELLATSTHPAAVPALLGELDGFITGRTPEGVQLDLLEAAAARSEAAAKEKLAVAQTALAARQRSLLDLTLDGGDPVRGRDVFMNQGTCLKCHRIQSVGGRAGPKLDELAKRQTAAQILDSLVNPGAAIVDGFGIATLTLDDGTVVAGTPLEETPDHVAMRTPAGAVEKIVKSRIKERAPPVSPMPPLGLTLAKKDLRDLMAYLRGLQ
jgi:quinoprotein glucose dehydrogenase